ncbi:hypothetical protein CCR83_03355 [Rhodobacter veldkampii DSM 11550]|uniref:Uncharacterized protein n=1 Tax=Phaeovulum veldkampii DSM 11550 TaxID=1185920 RepID=A0A2T4JMR3_9RHOB|nr:DUF6477 family protein [Phaeovulum veldkampii]MBK5945511.1 hypothetical protein [Phaeovulum veldkampii DSM 11550]NCU21847.1 hypothetical protein [Candidatus Falkowbacteria bacterium]PTE19224.1 hypothetical protein C5F46_00245 [Phaeovulum veldkampii DSM 11550]TDQ62299.1 hypothetical protein EV658_103136 [Phaeovulum veldkampii DSM 11550]
MTDLARRLTELRRPRLLIRAARLGLGEYDRARDLRRLLRLPVAPATPRALAGLLAEEAALEETRRAGAAGYSLARHIDILIAVMGEARLLPPTPPLSAT